MWILLVPFVSLNDHKLFSLITLHKRDHFQQDLGWAKEWSCLITPRTYATETGIGDTGKPFQDTGISNQGCGMIPSTPASMPLQDCPGRHLGQWSMTTLFSTTRVLTTTVWTPLRAGWHSNEGMPKRTHSALFFADVKFELLLKIFRTQIDIAQMGGGV